MQQDNRTILELLKISNEILEIVNDKDEMPNGDYQGAIEAQVMIAYQMGKKENLEYIGALEYGRSEEELDYIKNELDLI